MARPKATLIVSTPLLPSFRTPAFIAAFLFQQVPDAPQATITFADETYEVLPARPRRAATPSAHFGRFKWPRNEDAMSNNS
jgi:hypothetical protein